MNDQDSQQHNERPAGGAGRDCPPSTGSAAEPGEILHFSDRKRRWELECAEIRKQITRFQEASDRAAQQGDLKDAQYYIDVVAQRIIELKLKYWHAP